MNMQKELKSLGIQFSKKQGQCLLVESNVIDRICDAAELSGEELVIDIGTGPGHLVKFVAPRCGWYVGVELDRNLFSIAERNTADIDNCTLINGDILKGKRSLNPEVLDRICELYEEKSLASVKVVANLPYHISVPVIIQFMVQQRIRIDLLVVMVQREIAGKLRARPGTAHFKSIAVHSHLLARNESVMLVGKDSFFPVPAVESAVIRLIPFADDDLLIDRDDVPDFIEFTKKVFNFPKKNVVNSIKHSHVTELKKPEIEQVLQKAGLDPFQGIAQLTVQNFTDMYKAFTNKG